MADKRPPMAGAWARLTAWVRDSVPTREQLERNRWLRPVAHRVLNPALWRFTRRSVPRGVALGMMTGILIPLGQIPAAAFLALPLRANIPAAAMTTLLTNPVTTPPLWLAAYWLGSWMLRVDAGVPGNPLTRGAETAEVGWVDWLLVDAGPATLTGLVTIALLAAGAGYLLAIVLWRARIARKWRERSRRG